MKLICIGRNYTAHIEELENERPKDPVVFIKADSAVLPKEQDFYLPPFSNNVHHEVELLVKITKVGKHIAKEFAHKYYDEVSLGIDFTARDVQDELKSKGLPWEKAKSFDGSAVIGKWVSKSNYNDLNQLSFSLKKNNEVVQSASSELMLWKIDELISYVSQFFTLKKGDIIFSGTPSGVGKVEAGDVLEGFIENESFFKVSVK
ncbi:MAG: Fumarylpyruvate hydrolase [Flavobacteriaceae bacterium]|jgi:2-keto-4-pentenoate hydratase/2-oxohepta-3-ene-1,7-dioic acid hydratase in catechol pathway|nr:fumarylacetoacetate hydrolase family protein [Flavobacteriaceae bacterium]CAI8226309.1 MAG: Fumarylpyruvate hydrolase [Flavobacteriaceae bacterium]